MNPQTTPPAATTPLAGGVPDQPPAASPAGVQPGCELCGREDGDPQQEDCPVCGDEPEPGGATSAWEHRYGV